MEEHISKKSNPKIPSPSSRHFPHELLLEIFSKLPPKSLCRFKLTSKSINSSIKDPLFITKHRPKTLMHWQILYDTAVVLYTIFQTGDVTELKKIEFHGGLYHPKVVNGLICFQDCEDRLCLYNPTTEKLISLPEWEHKFEFAYVANQNQYKVLAWKDSEFYVVTLGKDSCWKAVMNNLGITASSLPDDYPAVNVNGFLYWLDREDKRIISFDLVREEFAVVGLPKEVDCAEFEYTMFEFEGGLCFVDKRWGKLDIVSCYMLKNENVWVEMLKNVVMSLKGTKLGKYYDGVDDTYSSVVCGNNGEVMVLAADNHNAWIFVWDFVSGGLRRIKVSDEQCCINMLLVRKHVENGIDLRQFRKRRGKGKRARELDAGSGGGNVSASD